MSGLLQDSPATIVNSTLVQLGLGVLWTPILGVNVPQLDWTIFTADEPNEPDNCITIYDTAGIIDAITQVDAEVVQHDGIQIRIRARDHPTGWAKSNSIAIGFSEGIPGGGGLRVQTIVNGVPTGNWYLVQAVVQKGTILSLGRDAPNSDRRLFTINFVIAVRQLPYGPIPT